MGEQKKPNNPTPTASSITVNVVISAFVQAAVELPRSTMHFNHSNRERERE